MHMRGRGFGRLREPNSLWTSAIEHDTRRARGLRTRKCQRGSSERTIEPKSSLRPIDRIYIARSRTLSREHVGNPLRELFRSGDVELADVLAETCNGRCHSRSLDRETLICLDRVERLGERRDPMRDDDDVGVLKVCRDIVVGSRPEQMHVRAARQQIV